MFVGLRHFCSRRGMSPHMLPHPPPLSRMLLHAHLQARWTPPHTECPTGPTVSAHCSPCLCSTSAPWAPCSISCTLTWNILGNLHCAMFYLASDQRLRPLRAPPPQQSLGLMRKAVFTCNATLTLNASDLVSCFTFGNPFAQTSASRKLGFDR